jgi:single-strand DNA-binding protein
MNKVILIGRVTKEIDLKKTQTGKSVIRFTLAVDKGYGEKKKTNFIDCQAWEGIADTIYKYVLKGDMISVSGELVNNNFESNGVKQYSYIVNVNEMYFLPNKREKKEFQDTLLGGGQAITGGTDDNFRNKKLDEFDGDALPFY